MFNSIAEAFNSFKDMPPEQLEQRGKEIRELLNSNADVNLESLKFEAKGLREAIKNMETRKDNNTNYNPITGADFSQVTQEAVSGDIYASKEYRSAFFKTLLGQSLEANEEQVFKRAMEQAEKRSDAFNTVTNAAAVLPTTTLNEVISKARTMGGLLPQCRGFNIPTKIAVPVGTPTTKAQWHTEGELISSEKATVAKVTFDGYEILKVFSMSAAAKKMSVDAFESYIIQELQACVMECIADAIINGNGTGQGKGLNTITWNAGNTVEYATMPEYTDFTGAMAKLKRGYSQGAKWAMNNATLYSHAYSIVDENKRPIFIADPKNESIGYILGREVVIDDNIADGDIYLGNFNYMGYNIPEGIVIEVSRDSSFKSGLIDYRAMAIADCKPIVEEAFIKIHKTL